MGIPSSSHPPANYGIIPGTVSANGFHHASAATQEDKNPTFKLGTSSIDEDRPFKVVVIGAGLSGLLAGIRFPQRMKNLDLTIYEKNESVGGTWWSNRYPGVACDYPAHCYQYTFEKKTDWSSFCAPGQEILEYIVDIVEKYKLMRYIKLRHELTHARYDEESGKWHLKLRRTKSGSDDLETFEDTADFVLLCVGQLSRWKWPDIEGLKHFKGKLMHAAEWPSEGNVSWEETVTDWTNKSVGVIGTGSSATQIVPSLQPRVGRLCNYMRGKLWLAPPFAQEEALTMLNRKSSESNYVFTDEDKKRLEDPEFFRRFRYMMETELNSMHLGFIKGSFLQKLISGIFTEHMTSKLQKKPWIMKHIKPDFPVGCRRVVPGTKYLDTLQEDNVELITEQIAKVTETGIELVDGTFNQLDVIICATGFDLSFQYPFEVIGRGGKTLNKRYIPHPETYLTLSTDGFPNWFTIFGPNSIFPSGAFLPVLESEVEYALKVAMKLQREHLKSIEPKVEAVANFDEIIEAYTKTTVFDGNCRSFYKRGNAEGRNVALWPGSCLHAMKTFKEPRWEDYNTELLGNSKNWLYWLGDGSTYNEKHMTGDRAWYLKEVDYPPVP